jgi:dTDP-4-dehydrorhamnose reductase
MNIVVFGSKGMLGNYVCKYLNSQKYNIIEVSRQDLDISLINENTLENFILNKNIKWVINCAGTIKSRIEELGELNALKVNTIFPRILANICDKNNIKCINISTDGVFDGLKGSYNENDTTNVNDFYYQTKLLGEALNCATMRVCPIGEEKQTNRSLIEWIKSRKNKTANGFTNHIWNGLTSLEVAKVIEQMIRQNIYWKGIRHIHSPESISKATLLHYVNDIFELNIDIKDIKSDISIDRSLNSIYSYFKISSIKTQIKELKGYL